MSGSHLIDSDDACAPLVVEALLRVWLNHRTQVSYAVDLDGLEASDGC